MHINCLTNPSMINNYATNIRSFEYRVGKILVCPSTVLAILGKAYSFFSLLFFFLFFLLTFSVSFLLTYFLTYLLTYLLTYFLFFLLSSFLSFTKGFIRVVKNDARQFEGYDRLFIRLASEVLSGEFNDPSTKTPNHSEASKLNTCRTFIADYLDRECDSVPIATGVKGDPERDTKIVPHERVS